MSKKNIVLFNSILSLLSLIQFLFWFKLLVGINTSREKCSNIILGLRVKATNKDKNSSMVIFTREHVRRKRTSIGCSLHLIIQNLSVSFQKSDEQVYVIWICGKQMLNQPLALAFILYFYQLYQSHILEELLRKICGE